MNERPIIFSPESVRRILAGEKTQTRRVLTHPNRGGCPYGSVGDRLWLQEVWYVCETSDVFIASTESRQAWESVPRSSRRTVRKHAKMFGVRELGRRRMPPAYMPRWLSRITLEITGVRVERGQDIGDDTLSDIDDSPHSWECVPWAWIIEFQRADQGTDL